MTEIIKSARLHERKGYVASPESGSRRSSPGIPSVDSKNSPDSASELGFIVIPVTMTERRVIAKYAEACGETIADIMRKSVIREATMADCLPSMESSEYQYQMRIPQGLTGRQERKLVESRYNQIRKIMGWGPIRI